MLIIAHRGASHDAPENTLAAARLAWAQGADALEVDVHLTRDGRLVVLHDDDTLRTAGVARRISDCSLAELKQLDVGRWKGARFSGERIPLLEEALALVPRGKRIFVEIKGGPEVIRELQRCVEGARRGTSPLGVEQIAIITFDLMAAIAAKRALPEHEVCWIADSGAAAPRATLEEIAGAARAAGLDGIDVDAGWTLDAQRVKQIRGTAFKMYVWTVDDAPLARRLAAAGVDGLTTNRPGWLRGELASP